MESPLSAPEPGTLSIDIWSDVMCPFCCLGDRHLELALEQFELDGQVATDSRAT